MLGLTQPALSKSLHEIETLLGVRLFERHARGVTANEFGTLVSDAARRILLEVNQLEVALDRAAEGVEGTVVAGALPVAAAGLLPSVVARLQSLHRHIRVKIIEGRTEEMLSALALGQVDLVVGRLYEPAIPDQFARTVLYEEPIAILARADHPIFATGSVGAEALSAFPLALPTTTQRVGQEIDQFLAALDLKATDQLRSSSLPLIREMLLSTDTVTVMPRLMMAGDLLRGTVRALPGPDGASARPAGLIMRRAQQPNPTVRAFVDALRACLAELEAETDESRSPR